MALGWYSDTGATAAITNTIVNTEIYAKLDFTEPNVRAVYIDWDDGESNKVNEANNQWYTTTEPVSSIIVPHTYNKTGNTFNPIVQTLNSNGIVSRYYANEATNDAVKPYSQLTTVSGMRVDDAAPTAIMRVQNTTVNSGIDNSIFEGEGPQKVYLAVAPTLTRAELTGTIQAAKITVEGVVARNKYDAVNGTEEQLSMGVEEAQETTTFDIEFNSQDNGLYDFWHDINTDENAGYKQITKVTYDSCKGVGNVYINAGTDYTTNEIFNRFKIFLVVKANDGQYYPITYVTAGSPVKSVEDADRFINMDMGQSRAAGSNVAISNYRYDNGKMWFNPINQWSLSTDILGTGTQQTNSVRPIHYTYPINPYGVNDVVSTQEVFGPSRVWYKPTSPTAQQEARIDQVALDDYGRFYTQYHIIRNSVVAASNSGSSIIVNQPGVYRVRPCAGWTSTGSATVTPFTDETNNMKNNGRATKFELSDVNGTTVTDVAGLDVASGDSEQEFILLTFDNKSNKVFFNATNYADGLASTSPLDDFTINDGLKIAGVEYLHIENSGTKTQNAYWKPLKFTDTTKISREIRDDGIPEEYYTGESSFAKSGYINFDMPSDWTSVTLPNLCGGVYNTASGSFSACTAAGFDDITVTGTTQATGSDGGFGAYMPVLMNAASQTALDEVVDVGTDITAYRYAFIITSNHTASGAMFWLASGSGQGYDGTNMYLQLGTGSASANFPNYEIPSVGDTITGSVRRINVYDVINNANKLFQYDGTNTTIADAKLMAVGSGDYNAGTSFFKNQYNVEQLTGSSWESNPKFILKIRLSGTTGAGGDGTPCPELFNVFDATQGHSAIVEQNDDSAYNLNSLSITSDLSVGTAGQYFKAISRRGKVSIYKTGLSITEIGFSSVALGDEVSSTAFTDHGPSTLYGHLHKIRNLQADAVPVYWDEPQKDGTFVRFWGLITNINETRGRGGPRAVMNYTFTLVVKDIALIKNTGILMTDRYPIGGLKNERDYS